MKSLSIVGMVLLGVASIMFYFFSDHYRLELPHIVGTIAGIGIGLIIGGIVGYISKGNAIKEQERRQELKRLRKEKEALEQQNITNNM